MRRTFRFIIISFWLFALTAPSILTLIDPEDSMLVTNFNGEEQEVSSFNSFDEEKMVSENYFALFQPSSSNTIRLFDKDGFICLDCTLEIILPPPEPLV